MMPGERSGFRVRCRHRSLPAPAIAAPAWHLSPCRQSAASPPPHSPAEVQPLPPSPPSESAASGRSESHGAPRGNPLRVKLFEGWYKIQRGMAERNVPIPQEKRIEFNGLFDHLVPSPRCRISSTVGAPTLTFHLFAVFRLMTSSNFVGCSTGKSAGLAPLNIL